MQHEGTMIESEKIEYVLRRKRHYKDKLSWQWLWSSGQHPCFTLRRTEFESRISLKFLFEMKRVKGLHNTLRMSRYRRWLLLYLAHRSCTYLPTQVKIGLQKENYRATALPIAVLNMGHSRSHFPLFSFFKKSKSMRFF